MPSATDTLKTVIQPSILTGKILLSEVRTRFAPSPTGLLHIGGLRTALYAYLAAKHYKGKFLIRIEDTDQTRLVKGAIRDIFSVLKRTGLEPDECPIYSENEEYIGDKGNFGPYVQSKRLDIYKKYAQTLIDSGKAYYCFCTPERLEKMRTEQTAKKIPTRYDRTCRDLSLEEIKKKLKANIPHIVRFKTPLDGEIIIDDLIRGTVTFKNSLIDDYVLLKSDGFPTYHLASVVDDYLMEITHIIRGEEWLPSAGLHKLLYEAFGWQAPYFAHLPIILAPGGGKLSKRQGDVAVSDYIAKGYLSEALLNFILFLGWNPGDEREIFSLKEMISEFTLDKIGKSGAIFDLKKLDWMNGWYIRHTSLDKLTELCIPYLVKTGMLEKIHPVIRPGAPSDDGAKFKIKETGEEVDFEYIKRVVSSEQERMKKLSDIMETTKYFFVSPSPSPSPSPAPDILIIEYDISLLKWKKMPMEQVKLNLVEVENILKNLPEEKFNKKDLEIALKPLTEKLGVGETLWPLRVALTGAKASPSPYEIAEVLGKEKVLKRIKAAIKKIT